MNKPTIKTYSFNEDGNNLCKADPKGQDWPVVYLINNASELYIGETSNLYGRFKQHRDNPARRNLKTVNVIYDNEFNKSAILDIEQYLIQYFGADAKFKLQNLNGGQSSRHNYYQRAKYLDKLNWIWKNLQKKGLANRSLDEIRNDDLFKFSPYNTLNFEQSIVCNEILENIINSFKSNKEGTSIITGSVGTGKTVVLINLMYKLITASSFNISPDEDLELENDSIKQMVALKELIASRGKDFKIAFVVQMSSIRETLKKVFKLSKTGLKAKMVKGPLDISRDKYDIVIVDEAHRLSHYHANRNKKDYKEACMRTGLDYQKDTTLDIIMKNSQYRVLVYDEDQRIKEADITPMEFIRAVEKGPVFNHALDTQMRCLGGQPYIHYIDKILSADKELKSKKINNYNFLLFSEVDEMVQRIRQLNKEVGLCITVAGYAWKWISKGKKHKEITEKGLEDIQIGDYKYIWNTVNSEFILSENASDEIGCIHTTQGYDLNYVGVIFGPEIDYDFDREEITIDLNKYYDSQPKATKEDKKKYIINAYRTMMGRGIHGCFIYACNENFRIYLSKFIPAADRS